MLPSAALGQPLQQFRKGVKAIVSLAERIHVRIGGYLHQLLKGPQVVGERHQQYPVTSAVGKDVRDMGIDGDC